MAKVDSQMLRIMLAALECPQKVVTPNPRVFMNRYYATRKAAVALGRRDLLLLSLRQSRDAIYIRRRDDLAA